MDLRRYKLIRERKRYIGITSKAEYQAMCEDMSFLQQSMKTILNDYTELFQKRFSEGLSIRKTAESMHLNRGTVERRQTAFYKAFSLLLRQRDEVDGILRITPNAPASSVRDEDE